MIKTDNIFNKWNEEKKKIEFDKFYVKIEDYLKFWLKLESYVLLNHFKVISNKRLIKKINNIIVNKSHIKLIDENFLIKIKELIKKLYKL